MRTNALCLNLGVLSCADFGWEDSRSRPADENEVSVFAVSRLARYHRLHRRPHRSVPKIELTFTPRYIDSLLIGEERMVHREPRDLSEEEHYPGDGHEEHNAQYIRPRGFPGQGTG